MDRPSDDHTLVEALKRGDERAFTTLVDRHSSWMMRTARLYVGDRAVAEEVVQEAWLGVLRGLHAFEERSSLKTWMFVILVNAARRRASREHRSVPRAELTDLSSELDEPAPIPDRFFDESHPRWSGCWTSAVPCWDRLPEERLLAGDVRARIEGAVQALPSRQRTVFVLRDMEGWSAQEVCDAVDVSDSNQRVLLHRARLRVREALASYFDDTMVPAC